LWRSQGAGDVGRRDPVRTCGGAGVRRIHGIRRRRQTLPWTQSGERAAAVGTHADFQPASQTGKLAAKIQRDGEQSIADAGGGVGEAAALLHTVREVVEQGEAQIVAAISRRRTCG